MKFETILTPEMAVIASRKARGNEATMTSLTTCWWRAGRLAVIDRSV